MNFWNDNFFDEIFEISYENIIKNPEIEIKKLLNFCNLEFEEKCLEFHKNKRAIKTVSINQARQPLYKTSVSSHQNYRKFLGTFFSDLEKI